MADDLTNIEQTGVVIGPDEALTDYEIRSDPAGERVIVFGSEDRPGAKPMYLHDLRRHLDRPYDIPMPEGGWRDRTTFSDAEKAKLRPIAETLAMLDGNAFFGTDAFGGDEWYEMYLPEAAALYERNGGDTGWAGEASFAKRPANGDFNVS